MDLQDVRENWSIIAFFAGLIGAVWRWIVADKAREAARQAEIERDIQKNRADLLEHRVKLKGLEKTHDAAWEHINKIRDDVGEVREGVARIEGVLSARGGAT